MQTRGKLIVGNWKMNGVRAEAGPLARAAVAAPSAAGTKVVICPPFTLLQYVGEIIAESEVELGGQDCHAEVSGTHTGNISAEMLADVGARYVIVGHSERRAESGETNSIDAAKAAAALRAGLIPIICVGETLDIREAGNAERDVADELKSSLPPLANGQTVVVAYEPIWAIGTGRACGAAEIASMHDKLRATLERHDSRLADTMILYGGSVNGDNACQILGLHNVDGALVGGASLRGDEFAAIVAACPNCR